MYLVIAEKPSVSTSIAKVLGAYKREDGYLEGNGCLVSWCVGHLAEYVGPEGYDEKYKRWLYEDLPIIPEKWKLSVPSSKWEQFNILSKLLKRPDISYVVNACDAGREGELIFQRVYELSGSTKPVKRLWISSMEDTAIADGFRKLKDGTEYENLKNAAVCRAQADWLIGMNATRAFTTKYHKKLTIGRVQTPTLAMVVERDQEIKKFTKTPYYNVELDLGILKVEIQKIFDESLANAVKAHCYAQTATVVDVIEKEKYLNPPKLYDLTTLQRDANRLTGMTAKETLDHAQKLYEAKLITYPRTDSRYLSEDMEETAFRVLEMLGEKYGFRTPFSDPAEINVKQLLNSSKVTDHHAIIPTMELEKQELSELSQEEKNLLALISLRMMEAAGQKHVYTETEIIVECADEEFKTKGKKVKEIGWKAYAGMVSGYEDDTKEKEKILPNLVLGQTFTNVEATKSEHFTSPPKAFSEDTLLAAMETAGNKDFDEDTEKKGLGTPATRASIIEKLVRTGYAVRKGKKIVSTEEGAALIQIIPSYLKSASMTAEWENQLLEMEKGQIKVDRFMNGIKELLQNILHTCNEITEEQSHYFENAKSIGTCPVCGDLVYAGKRNFYCRNRNCHFVLWRDNRYLQNMKKTIDEAMATELLKKGRVRVTDLYSARKDKYFTADLLMDYKDDRVQFALEFPKRNNNKTKTKRK